MTRPLTRMVFAPRGSSAEVETGAALAPKFDAAGTLAAVATDAETGEVLMLAWMNAEALALTIATGNAPSDAFRAGFANYLPRTRSRNLNF